MAASCSAIEQMTEVQQEGLQGEEKKAEEIIGCKTASQYRKELAQNKNLRGELTASQREMRERKLEAYDAHMKATGQRVFLGKWTEGLGEEKDAEEIIDPKKASKLRKELAENKTISGRELTSTERKMREGQLAAYDTSTKATGKRVYKAAKWSKQLCSTKNDTDAINGTTVLSLPSIYLELLPSSST